MEQPSASRSVDSPEPSVKDIENPPITESFCLLSPSSLPELDATRDDVLFLKYPHPGVATSSNLGIQEHEEPEELESATYEVWTQDWKQSRSSKARWCEAGDGGDVKILWVLSSVSLT